MDLHLTCEFCHIVLQTFTSFAEINNDISRRLESEKRWNGVELASVLQEKDAAEEEETILGSDEGEDDEDGSDFEDDSRSSLLLQASGNDAILTMQNANYKAIMYSFFRQVGAARPYNRDQDKENRVKNEAYNFFKGLGGRMMKFRNYSKPEEGLVEVDEKTARLSKYLFCVTSLSKAHLLYKILHCLLFVQPSVVIFAKE